MRPCLQVILHLAWLLGEDGASLSELTSCESKTNKLRTYIFVSLDLS